jgi:hypothetical protein
MATCFAHLRSALSAIEELSIHPAAQMGDFVYLELASGSVAVALVALDECNPTVFPKQVATDDTAPRTGYDFNAQPPCDPR